MLKKILLLILIFVSVIVSGNSVTYLNSCGKNSGWVNGETYILNFTEIPSGYANSWCLFFDTNYQDITIQGSNQIIDVQKPNLIFSYQNRLGGCCSGFGWTASQLLNFTWKDFSFSGEYFNRFFGGNANGFGRIYNNKFENIKTYNTMLSFASDGSTYANNFNDNIINNSLFIVHDRFVQIAGGFASTSSLQNNIINNSVIFNIVGNTPSYFLEGGTTGGLSYIYNSVVGGFSEYRLGTRARFYDSIVKEYPITTDPQTPNANIINSHLKLDVLGYRFIQDFTYSNSFLSSTKKNFNVVDEIIGSPDTFQFQDNTQFQNIFASLSFDNFQGIILNNNNKINCDLISDNGIFNLYAINRCLYNDDIGFTSILGTKNRGMVKVAGNNILINKIEFFKLIDTHNAQMISNLIDVLKQNITISNSYFYKSDNNIQGSEYGTDTGNFFLQLKYRDLIINDNDFIGVILNTSKKYEFLDIESNIAGNKIYLNNFTLINNIPLNPSEIFTRKADTNFYNNYIGSDIIISSSSSTGINATPYIGYLHTDGKIYYYNIGNYYEDNLGCVDGDSDGFCDSSYTSGAVTDTNPLSSYPFDYTAHLLTAVNIVDSTDFNITLVSPTDNQSIIIVDINDTINFIFSHDSDFTDLTCSYVIDASLITSIQNPLKNTNYGVNVNGFTEGTHTYRIECANDFTYKISSEISFDVSYAPTGGTGGTNGTNEGIIIDDLTGGLDELFNPDISTSSESISSFFSLTSTPASYLLIIAMVLVGFAILSLLFGVAMYIIR